MREREMQELMQQELAVPKKVHDGFEKGLAQIYHMDVEQERAEGIEAGMGEIEQKAVGKKGKQFWRRIGLAAAVAALVIIFHSPIYNFARSLFMHDTIIVKDKTVQKEEMEIVKIKEGVLTNAYPEENYFESMEDLGEKLGVSFLKSSAENQETGKSRVVAYYFKNGEVEISDTIFSCKDISKIEYEEDGAVRWHIDTGDAYTISCSARFHTKKFQDDYEWHYDDFSLIEEYETAGGFHATILGSTNRSKDGILCDDLRAVISYNNIWYEYQSSDCRLGNFKVFLDTLTK